eukprot:TRINITY_DN32880_c0_g1_i1.p2 TRINITY_DN32880_c0_g1~~TRINITY_DN32880_c0_g1_i1.p2  ORF type:complete len:342 (+),score=95.53 TRINITY_DN32880_c0_g1_i1:144-1169(+)
MAGAIAWAGRCGGAGPRGPADHRYAPSHYQSSHYDNAAAYAFSGSASGAHASAGGHGVHAAAHTPNMSSGRREAGWAGTAGTSPGAYPGAQASRPSQRPSQDASYLNRMYGAHPAQADRYSASPASASFFSNVGGGGGASPSVHGERASQAYRTTSPAPRERVNVHRTTPPAMEDPAPAVPSPAASPRAAVPTPQPPAPAEHPPAAASPADGGDRREGAVEVYEHPSHAKLQKARSSIAAIRLELEAICYTQRSMTDKDGDAKIAAQRASYTERMMQVLLSLDEVTTDGVEEIRRDRKGLIDDIQSFQDNLKAFKEREESLHALVQKRRSEEQQGGSQQHQ